MSKRPQRPSRLLELHKRFSPAVCLDFDKSVELFDLWLEGRQNETVEKNAPEKPKKTVQVPRYKTLSDLLGLHEHQKDFIESPEENELVEQLMSGELDLDQIYGIGSDGGSITDLLNQVRSQEAPPRP